MTASSATPRTAVYVIASVIFLYLADGLVYRLRGQPQDSVTVQRYYALHKTKEKTNYMFADPQTQSCARALFPHSSSQPCWYLRRHTEQRIDYE